MFKLTEKGKKEFKQGIDELAVTEEGGHVWWEVVANSKREGVYMTLARGASEIKALLDMGIIEME